MSLPDVCCQEVSILSELKVSQESEEEGRPTTPSELFLDLFVAASLSKVRTTASTRCRRKRSSMCWSR